jgi:hypothetical protein
MERSIQTTGGNYHEGAITAGTFIGRDQIVVLTGYTGEDLARVLDLLQGRFAAGQARSQADPVTQQLTIAAPDAPPITLSADAARDLLPVAARAVSEQAYLTALLVNPRYGRWASQFVPLAGTLSALSHPAGWGEVPPEFTLLEMCGDGPQRQLRRTRLDDITQALNQHPALALLPGATPPCPSSSHWPITAPIPRRKPFWKRCGGRRWAVKILPRPCARGACSSCATPSTRCPSKMTPTIASGWARGGAGRASGPATTWCSPAAAATTASRWACPR